MNPLEQPEEFETPITIGVISDTHFGSGVTELPAALAEALRQADLILHAGDFCSMRAYELIATLGELRGVYGNSDSAEVFQCLPRTRSFRFGRFSVAMLHGHGFDGLTARQVAEQEMAGKCDLAIFGHSHRPYRAWHDGTLLFNPGSPTHRRWEPQATYGIIRIDDSIDAELIAISP